MSTQHEVLPAQADAQYPSAELNPALAYAKIPASRSGLRRQTLKDEGQHQHSSAGDRPRDDRPKDAGRGAEAARQQKDPGPDHRPDDHRGQGRQADFVARLLGARFR